ncbi:LuxR family transcriptional regulator [Rhodococcus qingshengii]|uniref:LuxR family transcriptional regulator n=1 Tax=Rhodococcus qingshengii TaxID=334542 RepID=UPI001C5D9FF4|nr:LuxR family transcriptional regulator [Rhodococcus qingshengii]MBW4818775.1 LuxR family transcriptional regulator [Rhodococcus qingshengii]
MVDESIEDQIVALTQLAAGRIAMYRGDGAQAHDCLAEALIVFRRQEDLYLEVLTLQCLGIVAGASNHPEEALRYHREVLAITEAHGESAYRGRALSFLALAHWKLHRTEPTVGLLLQALEYAGRVNDQIGVARCLEMLAWCFTVQSRRREAAQLLGFSDAMREEMGAPRATIAELWTYHRQAEGRCRDELGEKDFENSYRCGRDMDITAIRFELIGSRRPDMETSADRLEACLTRREREVASLVARGMTNKEIAQSLVISPRTAEGHVEHILCKLGFTSRSQIAVWTVESVRNSVDSESDSLTGVRLPP